MSRPSTSPGKSAYGGFTLIELLIVLCILGLLTTVLPRFLVRGPSVDLRATAGALAADLRSLRDDAQRSRAQAVLLITGHGYTLGGRTVTLPVCFRVAFKPDDPQLAEPAPGQLSFFADGSATGGTVIVSNGDLAKVIRVRGLDGAVRVYDE